VPRLPAKTIKSGVETAARYLPFGKKPLRTFALVVALPAFLLYVGSAALVILALNMMASEIDRLEMRRGLTAMNAALDSFLNGLGEAVADEGTWNEAYLNVVVAPDPAWMDTTWGATARLGTTYDDVMVTDQAGLVLFGENNLGPIRGNIAARYPAASSMLKQLDTAVAASGDAAILAHFASDGRSPAGLAAMSIHQSTPGQGAVPRQSRRILWIAKHVTPGLLQDIAVRYQTPMPQLVTEIPKGDAGIDLTDPDGAIVGTLAWTPDQPGQIAFRSPLLIASAVFFVIGVLLAVGLRQVRRAILLRATALDSALAEQGRTKPADAAVAVTHAASAKLEARSSVIDGVSPSSFVIEYQPTLDLRSETMLGVDALLRWTRSDNTPLLQEELSPHDCSAMMDRAGIIALRHATTELAPLLGVVLTIAVTPDQLLSSVFAEKIVGTLGATNFIARRLQLAVDATLLPPLEKLGPPIADLRQRGISIAFSNFTLGPDTLDYVRPGLADRICLAPKMVAGMDTDPVRLQLIEATVAAARSADFAVTVAGVTRKEEAAKLLRLGCREFRGNLLAPPMPIAALTSLILAPAKPQEIRRAG